MRNLLLFLLLIPTLTLAELTPHKGQYDPRVRVVDYNKLNVVKIVTFYGVSTHIQFANDETIKDIAIGDDAAWIIVNRENNLFLKPKNKKADTNATVITNKRTYQFALVVHNRRLKDATAWADQNLIFSLSFHYPDEEVTKTAAITNKETLKARLDNIKKGTKENNLDYWVAGSEEISPTAARDDGRFIYLTFSNNRDMPAIYAVNVEGKESLINTHVIDGNTIVIQRLVKQLMLRKGNAVASVVNQSFDLNGGVDNMTGTVVSDVERIIKGTP